FEGLEVLDDRLAGQRERLGEHGRRLRSGMDQPLQDVAAGRIGEGVEELVERTPAGHTRAMDSERIHRQQARTSHASDALAVGTLATGGNTSTMRSTERDAVSTMVNSTDEARSGRPVGHQAKRRPSS